MQRRILKLLEKAKTLPKSPGCYLMKKQEEVIYIGKAKNLRSRVISYFQQSPHGHKTQVLVSHITDFDFLVVDSEQIALITENILIKKYQPRYNIRLRDDKSYPYIVLDYNEPFVRPILRREKQRGENILYLGPFATGSNIKEVVRIVKKFYGLRDCSVSKMRRSANTACLLYQMQQCVAPCLQQIDAVEYQKKVDKFIAFFQGDDNLLVELKKQMLEAAKREDFEAAALLRDAWQTLEKFKHFYQEQVFDDIRYRNIDLFGFYFGEQEVEAVIKVIRDGVVIANQCFSFIPNQINEIDGQLVSFIIQYYLQFLGEFPEYLLVNLAANFRDEIKLFFQQQLFSIKVLSPGKNNQSLIRLVEAEAHEQQRVRIVNQESPFIGLRKLQQLLALSEMPRLLECYDIAIWQGTSPTAAQIVFSDGKPLKEHYRHYHLTELAEGNNDFVMMQEVISRRIKYGRLPDVFIVDGGIGQVHVFQAILQEQHISIPVVGIAKSKEQGSFAQLKGSKSEERLIISERSNPYILKRCPSLMRIVVQMRDEAHRFSRRLHHKQEEKRLFSSRLDAVPHVGPRIKRRILKNLQRPLEDIVRGEIYQIMDELKVSLKVAKSLKEFFRPN